MIKKICYWCGGKWHWSHACHTNIYLIDLYQALKKRKGKIENNLVDNLDHVDLIHFNVFDFFDDIKGKIDHLTYYGNVHAN